MSDDTDDDRKKPQDSDSGSSSDDRGEGKPDSDAKDANKGETSSDDADKGGSDDDGDDESKKPSIFKKPLFWIILVAVVSALVIGGVLYWLHARQYESTDDAFVDSHIVRLSPQVGGQLVQVADVDNRHVDAGTLLAVVQPTGPEAQLAQSQAEVKQAQAQYAQALAQVESARQTAIQNADQAKSPIAAADKAAQDLVRYEALRRLDPNAVAGQQIDQARANARQTVAEAAAARRQVHTALANVAVARRAAGAARAGIDARRAQVQQANVTLNDLRLRAPVSGQVVNRQVNVGSYVAPGTQLMAIIPDNLWVTANFKETQLTLMRTGQPVAIRVDAYPDVKFIGHIDSVQRGAGQAFALLPPQNATGNYVKVVQRVPVRITFDIRNGPDPRRFPIGPGMSVVPTVKVR